jgi:hypothetical protein
MPRGGHIGLLHVLLGLARDGLAHLLGLPLEPAAQIAVVKEKVVHGDQDASESRQRCADYVFATSHGTAFLHHNVSMRVLRRAAVDAGLDRNGRRLRFHDLRHTFASHLIIDIRLDVAQVSRILGHARTSMTLDTYTHLFEEARHGADVRAELARSDFANLLTRTVEPRRLAGKQLHSTRPLTPLRLPNISGKRPRCAPRTPSGQHRYVTKT